jgi:hypothetical protein
VTGITAEKKNPIVEHDIASNNLLFRRIVNANQRILKKELL